MQLLLFALAATGTLVLGSATHSSADGGETDRIHACVMRRVGLTRIVGPNEACGPGETPRHWSITGPAGPPGPPGPAGGPAIRVIDFEGKEVGEVVGATGTSLRPVVVFDVGDRVVALEVATEGFRGSIFALHFLEEGCVGDAYIPFNGHFAFPIVSSPSQGALTVWVENDEVAETRDFKSRILFGQDCASPITSQLLSVKTTPLTLPYTPPFRVVR